MSATFSKIILLIGTISLMLFAASQSSAQEELIVNNGFETGVLDPWYSVGWGIATNSPHSGSYSAHTLIGTSAWIRQDFTPTPSDSIWSVTCWMRTMDVAWIPVRFYYGNGTYSNFILDFSNYISFEWPFGLYVLTDGIEPGHVLIGIQFWGGNGEDSDLWLDDVSILTFPPPPNLDITLTPVNPPIVIPTSGGFFDFIVTVTNNENEPTTFDIWTSGLLPNGLSEDPIFGPFEMTLNGGVTLTRQKTQYIPPFAPPGEYEYQVHVGLHPDVIWGESSFPFTKEGSSNGSEFSGYHSNWDFLISFGEEEKGSLPAISVPENFTFSAYPNPFNPTTTITFNLPVAADVKLDVFDTSGSRVGFDIASVRYSTGTHSIIFNGSDLPSGIYFYKLTAMEFTGIGKMVLIK